MRRYSNKPLTERQANHDDTVSVVLPASGTITPGVTNTKTVIRRVGPDVSGNRRYAYLPSVTVAPLANNQLTIQMRKAAAVAAAVEEEAAAAPGWGPWDDGAIIPSISWFNDDHQVIQIAPTGAVLFVGYQSSDDDYSYFVLNAGDLSTPPTTDIALPAGQTTFRPFMAAPWDGSADPITIAFATYTGDTFDVTSLHTSGGGFHKFYSGNAVSGYTSSENNPHIDVDSVGNRHAQMSPDERFSPNEFTIQYSKNEAAITKIFGSGSDTYAGGIAVDKADDNNIVMAWSSSDGGSDAWWVSYSDDNGATWSTPGTVSPFTSGNTFLDPEKEWHVLLGGNGVFLLSAPLAPYNDLLYVYSTDGGATWSSEVSHNMPTPNWGNGWQGSVSPDGNYFALWEADRSGGKVRCMLLQWTGSAFDVIVDKFEVFGNVDFADPSVNRWRAIHMRPTNVGGVHVALWIRRTGDLKDVIYRRVYTP